MKSINEIERLVSHECTNQLVHKVSWTLWTKTRDTIYDPAWLVTYLPELFDEVL